MTETLAAAVIGAGPVGAVHARALAMSPLVRLVAVCGRTAPRTEALAARHEAKAYLSVEEMMAAESPEVVSVCTPNTEHARPALAALAAGAHVLVEKPLAWRVEDARSIVDAAGREGCKLGVNFNHRFSAPYQRALQFIAEGAVGTISYVTVKFAGDLYKELNDPYCQLIETQVHSFDLMRLFAGDVGQVSAFLADPRGIGIYTSAAIAVRFRSGAVGTLLGSWDSSCAHPSAQILEVSGSRARVVVDNVVDGVRLFHHDRGEYTEWRPSLFSSRERDFWHTIDAHVDAFIAAVVDDREPPVSGEDGLRALELTYAAIRSFEEGGVIEV